MICAKSRFSRALSDPAPRVRPARIAFRVDLVALPVIEMEVTNNRLVARCLFASITAAAATCPSIGDRQHLRTTELPEDDGSHGVPPGRQMCADGPAGASVKSPSSSYSTVALASGWALDTHPLFLQTSRVP